jgi:hypothetical protein
VRQNPHWRLRQQRSRGTIARLSALVLIAHSNAAARDYFVNPTGADGAYPTVQSAVEAVAWAAT